VEIEKAAGGTCPVRERDLGRVEGGNLMDWGWRAIRAQRERRLFALEPLCTCAAQLAEGPVARHAGK